MLNLLVRYLFFVVVLITFQSEAQIPSRLESNFLLIIQKAEQRIQTGSFSVARQELERILPIVSITERRADILYLLIYSSYLDQDYERSYQWANAFLHEYAYDGRKAHVNFLKGMSAALTRRYDEAATTFDILLQNNLEYRLNGAARYWRAYSMLEQVKFIEAEKDFEVCLNDSAAVDYHDDALYGLAILYERQNRLDIAEKKLEQLLREFQNTELLVDASLRLASIKLKLGNPARTVDLLKNFKPKYDSQLEEFLLLSAEANYQLNNYREAILNYEKLLKGFPDGSFFQIARLGRAWSLLKTHDISNAHKEFLSIGEGRDSLADNALFVSGAIALLDNNIIDAIEAFDKLISRSPYDYNAQMAYLQRGLIAYRSEKFIEARRYFQLAARLSLKGSSLTNPISC